MKVSITKQELRSTFLYEIFSCEMVVHIFCMD